MSFESDPDHQTKTDYWYGRAEMHMLSLGNQSLRTYSKWIPVFNETHHQTNNNSLDFSLTDLNLLENQLAK